MLRSAKPLVSNLAVSAPAAGSTGARCAGVTRTLAAPATCFSTRASDLVWGGGGGGGRVRGLEYFGEDRAGVLVNVSVCHRLLISACCPGYTTLPF